MTSLSDPRPGASTGLVRNVSLPVLSYGVPASPRAAPHPRVPRVSSFSRMVKPAIAPLYRPSSSDDDDGLVPDLAPPSTLAHSHPPRAPRRRPRRPLYDPTLDYLTDSDDDAPARSPAVYPRFLADPDSASDGDKSHPDQRRVSPPPRALCATSQSHCADASLLGRVRRAVRRALISLHVFVPPAARRTSAPDFEAKFLFVAALSVMIATSAFGFALFVPSSLALHAAAAAIALAPLAGRVSGSLPLATGVCAIGVIAYAVAAARLASPVVLVWTSLVPVLAFAALGTRAGVAASFATAGTVCAADLSGPLADVRISPAGIIAAWVLFLGCTGVVQTQVKKAKLEQQRADSSVRWTDGGSCGEECNIGRTWGEAERMVEEQGRWGAHVGAVEVPDSAGVHRARSMGY